MATRTPAQSARLSRYSRVFGRVPEASLVRERRTMHKPQHPADSIRIAWETGRISWLEAQAMAKRQGVSL